MVRDEPLASNGSCPLDGKRVLDLTGSIGAYCTKLLADLGADVIKVEQLEGDPMRGCQPFIGKDDKAGYSALFASYHANKRSVTLDIRRDDAVPILESLAASCDVVIVSPTHRTPLAGFDRAECLLEWAQPETIIASITPFGLTGPWRDIRTTPFVSFAMGGGMHWVGQPDGPPLAAPGQLAWDEAGIHAALGIVSAIFGHERFGGQVMDFSVHDVAVTKDFLIERFDVGLIGEWGRSIGVGVPPTGRWECRDGPFGISAHQARHWEAFLTMLDHPDELSEPSLADPVLRREIYDGLQVVIGRLMKERNRSELFDKGQAAGLPCAPVNEPAEFVRDEQPLARGLFATIAGDMGDLVTIPWRWCHSSRTLLRLSRSVPSLGQHNREVYVEEARLY